MAARETIRLGVVSYLNVQPLIAHLSSRVDGIEICAEVPSRIAQMLARGAVDVAIVPTFALLTHPEWSIVPGVGIAGEGEVGSVAILSASPREEIERIYLDPASMTSSALVQVLFRRHWRQEVEFVRRSKVRMGPEAGTGYLVIGDQALRLRGQFPHRIDLGAAWRDWSGLPFVFAVWAVRPGVDIGPLAQRLRQAPDTHSDELFRQLAREFHREIGLSSEETVVYLRDRLRYRLGRREMLGLRLFLRSCRALGLGPRRPVRLNILSTRDEGSELG